MVLDLDYHRVAARVFDAFDRDNPTVDEALARGFEAGTAVATARTDASTALADAKTG